MVATNFSYVAKSPYCEHALDPATAIDGWVACECGRKSDVRWVRELGWLQAREEFVSERVTAGDSWYDTNSSTATSAPRATSNQVQFGEQLLYVLGGLSIFVAVGVFAAVSWETLGAGGQAGILIGLAVFAAVGAFWSRQRLVGLASTLAILSTVVLGVMLFVAPQYGLFDRSLLEGDTWYPTTVLLGLGLASAVAGLKSRITGWLLLLPAAAVVATPLLVQAVLPNYVDVEGLNFFNPVFYTLIVMGLNRYEWLLERADESNGLTRIVTFAAQAFLAFVSIITLPTIETNNQPWLLGISLALVAAMYGHLGYRWRFANNQNLDSAVAVFATPVVAGLAFSYLLSAPTMTSLRYADELALLIGGAFAAFVFLYPAFVPVPKSWVLSLNIGAIALWAIHFLRVGTDVNLFDDSNNSYVISIYFALIAAAALGQWNKTKAVLSYLLGVAAGVFAIFAAVSAANLGNNDPEYVTFPAALWLALMIWVLRKQSNEEMNSGIWLGIPLGMALIPSATVAVAEVDMGTQTQSLDWIRFWVVLLAGLTFTLIGTSQRITGLLIPGGIAYVFVVFPQLAIDLGLFLPRWVLFAVFGGLLISVAARYERLQKLRVETGSWRKVFR